MAQIFHVKAEAPIEEDEHTPSAAVEVLQKVEVFSDHGLGFGGPYGRQTVHCGGNLGKNGGTV